MSLLYAAEKSVSPFYAVDSSLSSSFTISNHETSRLYFWRELFSLSLAGGLMLRGTGNLAGNSFPLSGYMKSFFHLERDLSELSLFRGFSHISL